MKQCFLADGIIVSVENPKDPIVKLLKPTPYQGHRIEDQYVKSFAVLFSINKQADNCSNDEIKFKK